MSEQPKKSFEEAGDEKPVSLGREIVEMLAHNKKFWMIPIIVMLLILGSTGAAPFIYTLF